MTSIDVGIIRLMSLLIRIHPYPQSCSLWFILSDRIPLTLGCLLLSLSWSGAHALLSWYRKGWLISRIRDSWWYIALLLGLVSMAKNNTILPGNLIHCIGGLYMYRLHVYTSCSGEHYVKSLGRRTCMYNVYFY